MSQSASTNTNTNLWNLLLKNGIYTFKYGIYTFKINLKFSFKIWNLILKHGFFFLNIEFTFKI